ncbi:M14 family zinc carboxypeptidase [Myxococcota bacterium]
MMRRGARLGVVGAGLILLLPRASSPYPIEREGHEAVVSWETPVLALGPWSQEEGRLRLTGSERAKNLILTRAPGARFVRLRLRAAGGAWRAILFRAQVVAERPVQLRAYGLALNMRKGRVTFMRWDEGAVRETDASVEVPALVGQSEVEVCLWHVGSSFQAVVYHGTSKGVLASLSWSDTSYLDGLVGVQIAGRGAEELRISLAVAPVEGGGASRRTWLAPRRAVVLKPAIARALPAPLAGLLSPAHASPPGTAAFVTNETGVEALREQGVSILEVYEGVPFKLRDPSFFARAQIELEDTRAGVTYVEGLKDPEMVEAHLRAYGDRFPHETRLETLGHSVEGRPILALRIADDPEDTTRPVILLCAAHHANEAITPELVLDAIRYLLERPNDKTVREWLGTFTFIAVPMVNPDGSHAFWHVSDELGRTNRRINVPEEPLASGVDLNRNYPFRWGAIDTRYNTNVPTSSFFRGEHPSSEPEVMAMVQLAEREHYAAAVSYHAAATKILVPYTSGDQPNPEPSPAWAVVDEMMTGLIHRFRGKRYEAVRALYEVNGTDQDWHHHAFGTVALLVEAPYSTPARVSQIREAVVHSRHVWQFLLSRWLAGPSLSVHTVDVTGQPIEAVVTIDEISLGAGEQWSTRSDNGWYHQYLPGPGTYTVRAHVEGASGFSIFEIDEGVHVVELRL